MLPDISTRKNLFGINRKKYDDAQIHNMLNIKNHDGCTTNNAVGIIKEINQYLEDSRYLAIQSSVIFLFMKNMRSGAIKADGNALLTAYCESIDPVMLSQCASNMMRIAKSIAAQRRLAKSMKPVIKKNRIPKDWERLLYSEIDQFKARLQYLMELPIPENLKYTPLGAYAEHLAKDGTSIYDDMAQFIANNGSVFEEDGNEQAVAYMNHVVDVLAGLGEEETERLLKVSFGELIERKKRLEKLAEIKKDEDKRNLAVAIEDAKAMALHLCSVAGKTFRRERESALRKRARLHGDVYVVAVARCNPSRSGYMQKVYRSGRWACGSVTSARIFNTEQEAQAAAEEFRSYGEAYFAEVAKVELLNYGFDS